MIRKSSGYQDLDETRGVGIEELCGSRLHSSSTELPDVNPQEDDAKFREFPKRAEDGPSRAGGLSKKLVLMVDYEVCFSLTAAQRQTSGLTACAESLQHRCANAAERRPAVAKYRDTARQAAAKTERP